MSTMAKPRLSKNQRDALRAVHEGRVRYGSLHPQVDGRAAARAAANNKPWAPGNDFMVDGAEVYGQAKQTYPSLEERGLIEVRWDLVPTEHVPEATYRRSSLVGPGEEYVRPAYDRPIPGSRAKVELTDEGREALGWCNVTRPGTLGYQKCLHVPEHDGKHKSQDGGEWDDDYDPPLLMST